MAGTHILAIDQGTTSTRAIVFDRHARRIAAAQREFAQHYPQHGWVEHDPEDIWRDVLATAREAIADSGLAATDIAAIGITNQRETTVVWDRATGVPIHNAIVWQDRRTADQCQKLKDDGAEPLIRERTGLLLDPYFSGTKLAWLLDHVPGARARAENGELAFGTIDSFLLWRLTGGAVHATDVTNAARSLLFDIHRGCWDTDLCALLDVPMAVLPTVHDNAHLYGETAPGLFETNIPIAGMAGDQQAALFGQACFAPGTAKSTYGTGCFMLLNTGEAALQSANRLLTTPAYRLNGRTTYALEGSIFVAGAAVKWLRDGLGVITHARETNDMATQVPDSHGVYMVPAFVGLGAPHWDPDARAAIHGLTLDAGAAHLARAALEAVGYQTRDLLEAMIADGAARPHAIRVDGGMTALHEILNGEIWPREAIAQRKTMIEAAGLTWDVVESLPVHDDIKRRGPRWAERIEAYTQSLENLAAEGIRTVTYNFMPLLDWTRTDLAWQLPDGARALRFELEAVAVYDVHLLRRPGAERDYAPAMVEAAAARYDAMTGEQRSALERTIIAGLPGSEESFTSAQFLEAIDQYAGLGIDGLRANQIAFLEAVCPVADRVGAQLVVHPDDPPFPIFGLPRCVSTESDVAALFAAVPARSNGLCFCTGSFGVRADNDLPGMVRRLGDRIGFLHLRSVQREPNGAFHEAAHLEGDADLAAVVTEVHTLQTRQSRSIPMRPDHGHQMMGDLDRATNPGYSLYGRMRGLAELRGLERGIAASMR